RPSVPVGWGLTRCAHRWFAWSTSASARSALRHRPVCFCVSGPSGDAFADASALDAHYRPGGAARLVVVALAFGPWILDLVACHGARDRSGNSAGGGATEPSPNHLAR